MLLFLHTLNDDDDSHTANKQKLTLYRRLHTRILRNDQNSI